LPMLIRFYKRRIKKLRQLAAEPDVDLWALDEVHFQQHGSRCRMWVPPEVKEPVLLHAPTRKSVGYFAAVRLRDGKHSYAREEEKFNAQSYPNPGSLSTGLLFYTSRAKDDPIDSQLLEDLLRSHPDRLRMYQPAPELERKLELFCQQRPRNRETGS